MKKIALIIILIVTAICLFGCSKQISDTAYNDLITNLEKMNFNIVAEDVEKDILQGKRKWLTINENENISVYLYESSEKMEEDASYIHEGGTGYNNGKNEVQISWVSYPHFFKKDNMIVLYVGEDLEIINALEEILGPQFAGYEKIVKNDRPTVPENVPEGIEHLYDFIFSDRYDNRITDNFSLLLPHIDSTIGDTLFLLEKYDNEIHTVKEYLYDGEGMVPYMNKRYWYNFEKGNLMIGTHFYEPDNVEYISYLWSDIEGMKTDKNIAVGSTEKELLLAYTNDLYYINKEQAISGSDGLSVIVIIGHDEGNIEGLDEKYEFDYAYMWQPFTPETNELRDITFYIKDKGIIAIEIIEPFELRHVYGYDRGAGLRYTENQRGEVRNNGLNIENIPIELDLVSGEYRAIWNEGYKYDIPILINNLNDLEEFLSNHPAQSANENILQKNYNDEFFNQNVIYAFIKSEGSGSVKLTVKKAEIDGDILKLFMHRIVPDDGTTDMATRICLFGINRESIKDIKMVEVIILDKSLE